MYIYFMYKILTKYTNWPFGTFCDAVLSFYYLEWNLVYILNCISINLKTITKDLQGYFVIFFKFVCIWYTYILNFILIGQKNKKKYQRSPKVTKVQFVYSVKIVYIKHTCITNFISIDQIIRWKQPKVNKGHQRWIYAFA